MPLIRWQVIFEIRNLILMEDQNSRRIYYRSSFSVCMQKGLYLVSKAGEITWGNPTISVSIRTGIDQLEIMKRFALKRSKVIVADDLLATIGTDTLYNPTGRAVRASCRVFWIELT